MLDEEFYKTYLFKCFHIDKNEKRVMIKFRVCPALHSATPVPTPFI